MKKPHWYTALAGFAAAVTLFAVMPCASAKTYNVPTQAVLNQTSVNGVPMVNQSTKFPAIVSQAAVVMDMTTGTVVYAKNPLAPHYPASITKIMTAMLALQHGKLTDEISVSKDAANQPPDKLYFVPGEKEPLEKMLYGLLLISANDAAVAIAEKYGGSVSGFASMMNAEATQLGAAHTHFDNPNGLPDPKHVTTAYDMAVIARAAMQIPEFRKIVSTKSYQWQGQAWKSNLTNINAMLYTYPGAIGIKTGFTSVAHETLAVAATHGNQTFLAILMDAPTNYAIHKDAKSLLDFAFANYHTESFTNPGQVVGQFKLSDGSSVPMKIQEGVVATVQNGFTFKPTAHLVFHKLSGIRAQASNVAVANMEYTTPGQPTVSIPVIAKLPPTPSQASVDAIEALTLLQKYWMPATGVLIVVCVLAGAIIIRRRRFARNVSSEQLY